MDSKKQEKVHNSQRDKTNPKNILGVFLFVGIDIINDNIFYRGDIFESNIYKEKNCIHYFDNDNFDNNSFNIFL